MKSTGDKQLKEMIAVWHDIIDMVNGSEDIANDSEDMVHKVEQENEPVDASKKYTLLALVHWVNIIKKKR